MANSRLDDRLFESGRPDSTGMPRATSEGRRQSKIVNEGYGGESMLGRKEKGLICT